jgi:phage baseplate assembly protein V
MMGVFFRRAASGGVSGSGHGLKSPLPSPETCLPCRAKKSAHHSGEYPVDKETDRYIRRFLESFGRKLRNIVARGEVVTVDDWRKMQTAQVRLRTGEIFDGAERAQQYGFSSHPLSKAECFVVFCGAASDHPVILSVDDRNYRIIGSEPGEVVIYTDEKDTIHFKRGNIIEVTTKGDVIVDAGRSITATAGTSIAATAATTVAVTAGTTMTVTAGVSITLAAPQIFLNGNLSSSSGGNASFNVGTFSVNADSVNINEEC